MNTTMWLWKGSYVVNNDNDTEIQFYVAATNIVAAMQKLADEISLRGDADIASITGINRISEVIV
jgi:hypothetical protein